MKNKNFVNLLLDEKILNLTDFIHIQNLKIQQLQYYNQIINQAKFQYLPEVNNLKNIDFSNFTLLDEPFIKYINYYKIIYSIDKKNKKYFSLKDFQLKLEQLLWNIFLLIQENKNLDDKSLKDNFWEKLYDYSNKEFDKAIQYLKTLNI